MDFYEKAALVCQKIPYGKVATYGQIALLCGKPRNARQVGYALSKNKLGEIPAHRVVNSKGILSGAAAFETYDLQKYLLEHEGIEVTETENGRCVNLKKYGWKNTLEEALELQKEFEREG